ETAERVRDQAQAEVDRLAEELRQAQSEQAALEARVEALALSLRRTDGASALLATDEVTGLLGPLTDHVQVQTGREAAVAAALGWAGEALVADGHTTAGEALAWLRAQDQGRAGLLVPGQGQVPTADRPALPAGAVWAVDVITPAGDSAALLPALAALLDRVALVDDADAALRLVDELPPATAVTPEGDVYGPGWVQGGS